MRVYTDLLRMGPGKNSGATSVLWTPSGNLYFNFSRYRPEKEVLDWPLVLRRVYRQLGHHRGCAEIGCIIDALKAGDRIKGGRSLAMLHVPLGNKANRKLIPACEDCARFLDRLGIADTYHGR
ncbi:hypothetical protein HCJ93_03770 [Streptomyces sp. SBST2-5]|uniref:YwqJ-like deaminase n=1 Tax=Streptomyces composti TaxID=2720025 RepID=A0ABX1A5T5_9ACTN|nr:hypothetical protein [Streptomyces composti]NJP49214.1 hypothetical protein [Streptomyces composti]